MEQKDKLSLCRAPERWSLPEEGAEFRSSLLNAVVFSSLSVFFLPQSSKLGLSLRSKSPITLLANKHKPDKCGALLYPGGGALPVKSEACCHLPWCTSLSSFEPISDVLLSCLKFVSRGSIRSWRVLAMNLAKSTKKCHYFSELI